MLATISNINKLGINGISLLMLFSILAGAMIGYISPANGETFGNLIDPTLFVMITFLLFGVRFDEILGAFKQRRLLSVSLIANFVCVPLIGYSIAMLLLPDYPLIMVGMMIYFMSPCTDWFLGFTRIAEGNVSMGSALIPINMLVQLLLYPFYLFIFTSNNVQIEPHLIISTLLQWFLLPLIIALVSRYGLRRLISAAQVQTVSDQVSRYVPVLLSLLVAAIFASNITVLLTHSSVFIWLLLSVMIFFILTFVLSELLSRAFRFPHADHALLTITIAARNAPLMLAVTMVALPGQPLIYAAIVIGMLLEFPHLTLLTRLLRRRAHPIPIT
ncbi:arsenic resistance protein [Methylophaga lonarensis]|uniref:arsenic resistance protein n=1 Tax=Methylophaga lonarensis TaxID=999151 RepID=UPI003D2D3150